MSTAKKRQEFLEEIARMTVPGEKVCPECGGKLKEFCGDYNCPNCGESWPTTKVDEWTTTEALDAESTLSGLINIAREILEPELFCDPTNEGRAETAMAAMQSQEKYCEDGEPLNSLIVDLVTDLLHLAHLNEIEPDYIINTAQTHFDAEVEEEALERAGG
jgi:uncharacterized Zn finger protein (UPF0148 family)